MAALVGANDFLWKTQFYWKQAGWLKCVSSRPTLRGDSPLSCCIHGKKRCVYGAKIPLLNCSQHMHINSSDYQCSSSEVSELLQLCAHLQHSRVWRDHEILSLWLWGGVQPRTSCSWPIDEYIWQPPTSCDVAWRHHRTTVIDILRISVKSSQFFSFKLLVLRPRL